MASIASLALVGGYLLENPESPGFLFFQSGVGGQIVDAMFAPAEGEPFPVYSLYTGLTSVLQLISGAQENFLYNTNGQMFIGPLNNIYQSGQMNINWVNNGDPDNRAGLIINASSPYDDFPDPNTIYRNYSPSYGTYVEHREYLGPGLIPIQGSAVDYGVGGLTYLANTFTNATYNPSASAGAETPGEWCGWKWSVQAGSDVYRKFGIYQNYIDIGTIPEDGVQISNGCDNFVALRRAVNPVTSTTPATAAIYYAPDSNLKIFTTREISLAPNISGITQLAYHSDIWTTAAFDGTRHVLTNAHNGKKVRINSLGPVIVTGTVDQGFTCECHVRVAGSVSFSGSSPLVRRALNNVYTGMGQYAVVNLARDNNDLIIWQ